MTSFLARLAAVFLAGLAIASPAAAQLTGYDLVLTIESVQHVSPCQSASPFRQSFGCIEAGDSFSGSFAVDTAILGSDGLTQSAAIHDFYLPFGSLVYATGPLNTALAGFRNPALGAAAPGFLIENGQVVDFFGGVYSFADSPFIDMNGSYSVARNHFYAYDGATAAYGTLSIASPAPEPDTLAMLAAGFGMVVLVVRRRRKASLTV